MSNLLWPGDVRAGDERPAGAWQAEWDTRRTLLRRTVVAAGQTSELLAGLEVQADRTAATLEAASDAVPCEQRAMADLADFTPAGDYLGAADAFIEDPLARAEGVLV